MTNDPLRGKTIAWSYEDGPVKGQRFEHAFHDDGTVSYRMTGARADAGGDWGERCHYEAAVVGDVWTVSYLAPSGWTLTTVLDTKAKRMVSFASNEKQLVVQKGTFEPPR